MPFTQHSGTLGIKKAAHLLRRAAFGGSKQEIDAFAALTAQQAVVQLFRQQLPTPSAPINPKTNQDWVESGLYAPDQMDFELQDVFKKWLIGQMLASGVPSSLQLAFAAREKIVFFLHTHFTTIQEKVGNSRSLYFQNVLLRLFALDALPAPQQAAPAPPLVLDFKNLTVKVSVDNAMIALLDGNLNVRGSVNENYARELLELYSIGRGLEHPNAPPFNPPITEQYDYGVYKEEDVRVAARVLSGWTTFTDFNGLTNANLDPETGLPRATVRGTLLNATGHDNTLKVFSSRMPGSIVADPDLLDNNNPTEESALDEIKQLVDLIYAQRETAKYICRKLYRFFIYHEVTPQVENDMIDDLAQTFIDGGFKLQLVYERIFTSAQFYDSASNNDYTDDAIGGIIKSPLELILSTLKFFNVAIPNVSTDSAAFYTFTGQVLAEADNQGMKFFQPFDVAGYEAYHQYPIFQRSWINVNYLTRRYDFIRSLVDPMAGGMVTIDAYQFVLNTFSPTIASDARLLVLEICKYLLPVPDNLTLGAPNPLATIALERLNYFKVVFLSDIDPDPEAAWTTRWNSGVGITTISEQLERLFNVMLQTPEYQLQ
jgi:uncharacterized protein (DUF1800 family)